MAQPYVGEIRIFAGNFAPRDWELCEGQLLPISEYETLFNLIGTTYGGDGESTFALPDMRGRIPVHQGTNQFGTLTLGETGGLEEVTLSIQQIPAHLHQVMATPKVANTASAKQTVIAKSPDLNAFFAESPSGSFNLKPSSLAGAGGGQPHTNLQPYLCVNYIISLLGIYPSPA